MKKKKKLLRQGKRGGGEGLFTKPQKHPPRKRIAKRKKKIKTRGNKRKLRPTLVRG